MKRIILLATVFLTLFTQSLKAQNKLLTIDDILDPVKKVNFNGTTPTVRWLKDGNHYLITTASPVAAFTFCNRGSRPPASLVIR